MSCKFSRKEKLDQLLETGELLGHRLSKRGKVIDPEATKTHLIDGITSAINVRFQDMMNDELHPTIIAGLKNWPEKMSQAEGSFMKHLVECLLVYCSFMFSCVIGSCVF